MLSSLIKDIDYDSENRILTIFFVDRYFKNYDIISGVSPEEVSDFLESESLGKYYLQHFKNRNKMADLIIQASIDLSKIDKNWLVKGEKTNGIYANLTIIYNEKSDKYGQNGFIIQKVPKEIYEANKEARGPIIGNIKVFEQKPVITTPGEVVGVPLSQEIADDLPF
jgi:hypothetical protein